MYKEHHNLPYGYGYATEQPSDSRDLPSTSRSDSVHLSGVSLFKRIAREIKHHRIELIERFPKGAWFPNKNDMEWCAFCLGSAMCLEIYGEKTPGEKLLFYRNLPHRHTPVLSIVLHMGQPKVILVLGYLHQWFLIKGMKNVISMWLYALLACLDKSGEDYNRERLLEGLYKDCRTYLRSCGEWQKPRVNLIMGILENYFYITPDNDSE